MATRQLAIPKPAGDAAPDIARQARTGLLTMAIAVVQTSLIAWFGFQLSGRLELAIKERQMNVTSATAMSTLVEGMQDDKKTTADYKTQVRKIAMYGPEAIQPLLMMAAATAPYSESIPLDGVRLLAIGNRKQACESLRAAVDAQPLIDAARFQAIKKLHEDLKC